MKKIVIHDCMECPKLKKCKAWSSLSKEQRFKLTFGVGVGKFILKSCPLEDND